MGLIAWAEGIELWAVNEDNNAKTDAKNGLRDYRFSTHNTLNEGKPRIDSKRRQGRERGCGAGNSGLAGEPSWQSRLPLILMLFSRTSTTRARFSRARFEEPRMDYSVIPWASWRRPARQRCRAGECARLGTCGRSDLELRSAIREPRVLQRQ